MVVSKPFDLDGRERVALRPLLQQRAGLLQDAVELLQDRLGPDVGFADVLGSEGSLQENLALLIAPKHLRDGLLQSFRDLAARVARAVSVLHYTCHSPSHYPHRVIPPRQAQVPVGPLLSILSELLVGLALPTGIEPVFQP